MIASLEENKKQAWEAFNSGRLRLESRPFRASIEITRNCNFKCNMCPQSWMPEYRRYHPEFNMSPALFERITQEVFPHLEYAHLQGFGETVISPHWFQILEMCRPFVGRVEFGLVTNLGRRNDAMWRRMVEMGFNIHFSCDGATQETFEEIRRGSSFGLILHNLEILREARRESGAGQLSFRVTLQKRNAREMPLFVDLAERCEVPEIAFASVQQNPPRTPSDYWATLRRLKSLPGRHALAHIHRYLQRVLGLRKEDLTLYDLARQELVDLKNETLRRAREAGVRVLFTDSFLDSLGADTPPARPDPSRRPENTDYAGGIEDSVRVAANQRCFKPFSYVVINYKGDVGLCNHLITDDSWEQMGSLQEDSFETIWNAARYLAMRRKLGWGEPPNKTCRWCFLHRLRD